MPFEEDLTPFFAVNELGTAGLFGGRTAFGVFDIAFADVLGTGRTGPSFQCAAASVPNIAQGDLMTINAVVYRVVEIEPDGTGVVLLRLAVN